VTPAAPKDRKKISPAAVYFERARKDRSTEIVEDYVEAVADLIRDNGEARVVDIADRLGVTHVTVIRTLSRLQKAGWVVTRPYKSILLTASGQDLAKKVRARHQIVERFLCALGVDRETARADAEGIEHHVSEKTLRAFERFVREGRPPRSRRSSSG
jgi:DtxR family manganese transport transcriptional regulator